MAVRYRRGPLQDLVTTGDLHSLEYPLRVLALPALQPTFCPRYCYVNRLPNRHGLVLIKHTAYKIFRCVPLSLSLVHPSACV